MPALRSELLFFVAVSLGAATYNVREFGAVPDGKRDSAPAIQRAINAAALAGGGVVFFPPSSQPYLLRQGLRITASNIHLRGPGASLLVADGAFNNQPQAAIEVRGRPDQLVSNIRLEGFCLDANYFSLKNSKQSKGAVIQLAADVVAEDLQLTRVYVGISVRRCRRVTVRRVTVTDYAEDAFDAGGDADTVDNGKSLDILFDHVVARDAPRAARDGNGFEIEDGATRVRVLNSLVENVGGNGAGLRNHNKPGLRNHTSDIEFRNVRFRQIGGEYAVLVKAASGGPAGGNTYQHVRLINIEAKAPSAFWGPIDGLLLEGGTYGLILLGQDKLQAHPGAGQALVGARLHSVQAARIVIAPGQGSIEIVR